MQYYYPQKIAIEEPTLPDVFTDREEIIERLVQMALEVPRRRTSSMVLLGRRRIGKTSVLLRVYNWLFSEQEEVVPIYINLEKCGKTIADFGERYFLTFLMQYLAFKRKDCGLFEEKPEFQWLYHIGLEHPEDKGLQSILRSFKIPWDEGRTRAFHTHAIYAPATVSALNESSIFVMVDEFQHINSFLYRDDSPATATITGYYQTVVESFKCPHLLSGSAVRVMMYRVINGPLAGRFDFEFLEPLSDEDSIEFMAKLSAKEEIQIGEEEKNLIVERTGGNPYYIDCMIRGAKKQRITRLNKESLNEVFAFEVVNPKGKINEFLREQLSLYFQEEELDLIKLIFFYTVKFEEKEINQEAIAKAIAYPKETVYKILCKLANADLIEHQGMWFRTLKDEILREFIRAAYESEIERLDYEKCMKTPNGG